MLLQPNTLFHNRYILLEMKGRGSFGEVWLARDKQLDTDVAIKVYIALDTRGVEEFKTEYKTAFGLNHPYLLHAYHFDICEDRPYLVMPYCPGSAMNYIGKIDEPTLWHFVHDVASGLEYLHGMGIIHHDIKPDNILIDENGKFQITDFGISVKFRSTLRRNSARQVTASQTGGSIPYMAPELFSDQAEAVNATDIWALGVTMYELMTGELPFFGQGGAMQNNGAKIPELQGDWSEAMREVVKSCLAVQSWDRPTAKQLVEYADAAIDNGGIGILSKKEEKPKNEGGKKNKLILFVVLGAIVLSAAGIGIVSVIQNKKEKEREELRIKEEQEARQRRIVQVNEDYRAMVDECFGMISQGTNAKPQPFLDAKDKLKELKSFESSHYDDLDKTVADSISSVLDVHLEEAARVWADAAKSQAIADQEFKALDFYKLSLRLYELPETRQAYEELNNKLSLPLEE